MNENKAWWNTASCLSIFVAYNFLPTTKNECGFSIVVNLDYSWKLLQCWVGYINNEPEDFVQELLNSASASRGFCLRWIHKEHTHANTHTHHPHITHFSKHIIHHITHTLTHISHISHTFSKHILHTYYTPRFTHLTHIQFHTTHLSHISNTYHTNHTPQAHTTHT